MKSKIPLLCVLAAAAVVINACGGNNNGPAAVTPPPTSGMQALDTAQVLTLAQSTSETAAPFMVNGGAFSFTDTSETTAPIAVNQ